MTSEQTLKVKLVKCPKCRKVLPLLPDISIYKCGGCSTLLQAKSKKNRTSTRAGLHEGSTSQTNGLDRETNDQEQSRSNQKSGLLSPEIYEVEKNDECDPSKLQNCNDQRVGGTYLSCRDSKNGNGHSEHRDFDAQQLLVSQQSKDKTYDTNDPSNSRDVNNTPSGIPSISSKGIINSNDQAESGAYSPGPSGFHWSLKDDHPDVVNVSSVDKMNRTDQNGLADCNRELQNYSNGVQPGDLNSHSEGDENEYNQNGPRDSYEEHMQNSGAQIEEKNEWKDQNDSVHFYEKWPKIINEITSQPDPADAIEEENSSLVGANFEDGETSQLAGMGNEENLKRYSKFNIKKHTNATQDNAGNFSLLFEDHVPDDGSVSSYSLLSSSEQLEHSQKGVIKDNVDSYAASEYGDHSSEFSGHLRNLFNSPAIGRSHTNDGSVSYYDKTHRHSQPLKVTDKVYDSVLSDRKFRRDKHLLNTMMYKSAELQGPASSSTCTDKNPYTRRNFWSGQVGDPKHSRYSQPIMNSDRSRVEQHQYRVPLHQEDSLARLKSGGLSNQYKHKMESKSSNLFPYRLEGIKQERMELLRTVHELEDQLNKTRYLKGVTSEGAPTEVAWSEKNYPTYYNQEAPEEQIAHDLSYTKYPDRNMRCSNETKDHKFSRMPYSGEVLNNRHGIVHSSNYRPRDWRFSAPLPPPVPYQNHGLSRSHTGSYSPYDSCPSSPQPYIDPKYSFRGTDALSDGPTYKEYATMKHLKVDLSSDKQHFLPTAGGAPFITCYRCLNLLQLPGDLVLFKRKSLRLKCGSCSTHLKFSFQNRLHVAPHTGNTASPPNEEDDNSDMKNKKYVASKSHAISSPILYRAYSQKLSYYASLEPEHSDSIGKQFQKRFTDAAETCGVSSPSKKPQSEKTSPAAQELLPPNGSPLHRLMGYPSPSHLINGYNL